MNDFENRVMDEFVKKHSMRILSDLTKKYDELSENGHFDSKEQEEELKRNDIANAMMHRFVYLALKEYHNCLSRTLAESGISLPAFDTVVEQYHED